MNHWIGARTGWGWRVLILGMLILFASTPVGARRAPRGGGLASNALLATQTGIAPGWQLYRPDAPLTFNNLSQHALRLSPISPNYPQIVYGGDHLYYAYQDGRGWHTTTVDSEWGVGSGAALALDANGKAYISYYDSNKKDLKFATNRWGGWQIDVVASTGDVGRFSDIAIDAWGDPSIVYYNNTTAELRFRYYDSEYGDWMEDDVVATGVAWIGHPGWFSLAMDPTAFKPHVSYYDYSDSNHGYLEWAHYDESFNWVQESVQSCVPEPPANVCRIGEFNSIAINPVTHQPAIAYSYYDEQLTQDTVGVSSYTGSGWNDDYYVPAMHLSTYLSLSIDSSQYVHIAWNENGLKYSWRNLAGTWFTPVTVLDASATAGQPISLAVAGTTAKVVYYNPANKVLSYMNHDLAGWKTPTTLATQGHDVGSCPSLAVDTSGRTNISYYDATNKHLLYARYSGGAWTYSTIDATGNASCFSVMAANPVNGDPTVAYINGGTLYYVAGNGTTWASPLPVDTGVYYTVDYQVIGMAIDSTGRPHMVYTKGSDAWYAVLNGITWTKTPIVTGTDRHYVAIAIGPNNKPWVCFYQSGSLKCILKDQAGWTAPEVIASAGGIAGVGVALAVDGSNWPMAAFLNGGGSDLSFTRRVCIFGSGCSWTSPEMIDPDVEEYFSLAVDRSGNPHLAASALSSAGFRLDYLTQKDGAWSVTGVDTSGWTGWYPSISLTADGTPRISYYDINNDDLNFIVQLNVAYMPLIKR